MLQEYIYRVHLRYMRAMHSVTSHFRRHVRGASTHVLLIEYAILWCLCAPVMLYILDYTSMQPSSCNHFLHVRCYGPATVRVSSPESEHDIIREYVIKPGLFINRTSTSTGLCYTVTDLDRKSGELILTLNRDGLPSKIDSHLFCDYAGTWKDRELPYFLTILTGAVVVAVVALFLVQLPFLAHAIRNPLQQPDPFEQFIHHADLHLGQNGVAPA